MWMRSIFLATTLALAGASTALAQDSASHSAHAGDVAVTYDWVHTNAGPGECGCFGLNGGGLSGSWSFHTPWSVVVDVGAETASGAPTAGNSLTLSSYLAGVRYSLPHPWWSGKHKPEPFAQVLMGAAHAGGGAAGFGDGSYRFAARVGGGIDVPLSPRFALRAIQLDYYPTTFRNSVNDHQNNLLVGAGFVFRWSR